MTVPEQPTPEAIEFATDVDLHSRFNHKDLALLLTRFAAQRAAEAVELEQHRLEAERQKILGDPRVDVHVPPADWGLPQNAATPPPGDAGERARKIVDVACRTDDVGRETREVLIEEIAAALQSERTAAASQALLGAALVVEDEQDRGGSPAGAAHRLRALAHPQESAS